ncbi:hypothetical protein DV515_00019399, partial [Chloebia gouldiae]
CGGPGGSGDSGALGTGTVCGLGPLGDAAPRSGGAGLTPEGGMWQLGVLIPLLGGALRVTQDPGELQVTTGGTVALECQVEVAESEALLRMEWVRAGGFGVLCATRLHLGIPLPLFSCPHHVPGTQLAWQPPWATLSLPQVQGNDSGRYLCRVTLEIPRHGTATGNGTELRVTPGTAWDCPGRLHAAWRGARGGGTAEGFREGH